MKKPCNIKAPFFEIGPKSYLYGQDVIDLAIAADKAAEKYGVDIIFTTPIVEIARVKAATKHIHVFAPHMDPIIPGRGLADVLPESLVAAGAEGVMLNHVEKPLTLATLKATIKRAEDGIALETVDRTTLFAVQTPQVFDAGLIRAAIQKAILHNIPKTPCFFVSSILTPFSGMLIL